ncbi:MAG: hypothetical protein ACM3L6_02805 [Deltaproteobacteria bacterium]
MTPEDGGFDLRFGRISPQDFKVAKQVTVRISSDTGEEYRVIHRLQEPLRSGEGVELPVGQFQMYPLINTNSRGSLLTFPETPVGSFDGVLYASDAAGQGDSFRVVYTVTPWERQVPGTYRGRITYILVPVKSTASQVVVNLDVLVELAAGAQPAVEVVPEGAPDRLELKTPRDFPFTPDTAEAGATLFVRVLSPLGERYRIFQSFDGGEPTDNEGRRAQLKDVLVRAEGGTQGAAPAGSLQEARGAQLLYTSDTKGAPVDLAVRYVPGRDFWMQQAGTYRGRLTFYMETESGSRTDLRDLDVVMDVGRLFDIYVTSGGKEGVNLDFGDVSSKTGPRTSEVALHAVSNLGRPYQIVQVVSAPMTNEEGVAVPLGDFTVYALQDEGSAPAATLLRQPVAVRPGETVVATSDAQGHSTQVTLVYQLTMGPDSKGGRYTTQLGYSLVLK